MFFLLYSSLKLPLIFWSSRLIPLPLSLCHSIPLSSCACDVCSNSYVLRTAMVFKHALIVTVLHSPHSDNLTAPLAPSELSSFVASSKTPQHYELWSSRCRFFPKASRCAPVGAIEHLITVCDEFPPTASQCNQTSRRGLPMLRTTVVLSTGVPSDAIHSMWSCRIRSLVLENPRRSWFSSLVCFGLCWDGVQGGTATFWYQSKYGMSAFVPYCFVCKTTLLVMSWGHIFYRYWSIGTVSPKKVRLKGGDSNDQLLLLTRDVLVDPLFGLTDEKFNFNSWLSSIHYRAFTGHLLLWVSQMQILGCFSQFHTIEFDPQRGFMPAAFKDL